MLAIRLSRHTLHGWDNPALPDDVHDIGQLLNLSDAATRGTVLATPQRTSSSHPCTNAASVTPSPTGRYATSGIRRPSCDSRSRRHTRGTASRTEEGDPPGRVALTCWR